MKKEEYTDIFVRTKDDFLSWEGWDTVEGEKENKEKLLNWVMENEKLLEIEFHTRRAKISAGLSLLNDNESREKLNRRLKESKITYNNTLDPEGKIPEGRLLTEEEKIEKEQRKKIDQTDAILKSAIKAMSKAGLSSEIIHAKFSSKNPSLTLERVKEILGK